MSQFSFVDIFAYPITIADVLRGTFFFVEKKSAFYDIGNQKRLSILNLIFPYLPLKMFIIIPINITFKVDFLFFDLKHLTEI